MVNSGCINDIDESQNMISLGYNIIFEEVSVDNASYVTIRVWKWKLPPNDWCYKRSLYREY